MISVCMIVRNEESILEQAIISTQGLVDEIVVLDTGSTDNTVQLAKEQGCVVLTGGDRMHKAQCRNQVMEVASGDWVVILDADEQIADPIGLRAFLENTNAQAVYIMLNYMNGDKSTLSYAQMRCWRRGTFKYKYRAHEVPISVNGWGKVEYTDFVWEHRPPSDRLWKSNYTRDRLLLDIEENPNEGRPLYYYGRQQMYRGDWVESIDTMQKYLETSAKQDRADAYWCMSKCYKKLGDIEKQIQSLYMACATQPARRAWWGTLGQIYHSKGKYGIAVALFKAALEIPLPNIAYALHYWYGSTIYDLLARCLWKLGRYEEGQGYAQKAVELSPDNKRLLKNLLWFDEKMGDMDAFYQLHGADIHSGCSRHQAITELVKGPRVLDMGCGTGDLLLLLQDNKLDWQLVGTDISEIALKMAKERGVKAILRNIDFIPGGEWDTIIMAQVLEHINDSAAIIEEVREGLKPGGRFIVSVPNDGAIPSPHHIHTYTESTLTKLLETIGKPKLIEWDGQEHRLLTVVDKWV